MVMMVLVMMVRISVTVPLVVTVMPITVKMMVAVVAMLVTLVIVMVPMMVTEVVTTSLDSHGRKDGRMTQGVRTGPRPFKK